VIVIAIMLLSSSGQFSIYTFVLGLLSILTPLLLAIRSFWLMAKDETRSQVLMRAQETGVNISVQERGHADDQSSMIKE
jgi:hypothetical protein